MRRCRHHPRHPPAPAAIIASVIDSVKTDLSVRQLLEFAGTLKESQAKGLRTEMVPGRPLYIDEVSYWIPDMAQLRRSMVSVLGLTLSQAERTRMERAIRAYEDSIPADATEVPTGDTSVGRAVSADEAHSSGTRKKEKDKDTKDAKSSAADRAKNETKSRTDESTAEDAPSRRSADSTSSDSGARHASRRIADGAEQRTGGSSDAADAAPSRGAGGKGE